MRAPFPRAALALAPVAFLALASLALAPLRAEDAFRAAPGLPFAIDHIGLDLDVDLPGKAVSGRAELRLHAVRDLGSVRLDAAGLEVSEVALAAKDAPPAPAKFSNDGEHLVVTADLKRGDKASLWVRYAVHHPKEGLNFYGPTPKDPDVPLQVWSQGEARFNHYWFPCVDSPSMKQTSDVTVHVPAGFEALSNGTLAEKKDENGKTSFHWVQDKPHVAYLITLVVGKFYVGKAEWRGKPVLYYVPEKNKDDVARSFEDTPKMLEFFSEKIGVEYAWAKYAQVVVEQFGWGGMENTSATTLNDYTLHDARAHLDFESDGLVSHELAHQWWGDLLTCRDWAHIWLNEGFASYFEALWDEHKNGESAFSYNMYGKSQAARSETCKQKPVVDHRYVDPENVFDDRAYPKGAWVLHGLRKRVGDDAFWRAINRYAKAHLHANVETIDLRRAFEEETGESLERYFRDWTERPGHPVLDVAYEWHDADKLLEVNLRQTQPGEAFAFRADLAAGAEPQANETVVPVSFENEKEKRVLLPLAERPKYVRFDIREAVLCELTEHKGEDQWLVQLEKDKGAIGRIRAAHALADTHQPQAVGAVAKQLMADKEWFVSVECARALGKAGGDVARDGLVAGLAHANPKVRKQCVEALASWRRDEKVIGAVKPLVEKGDASYYVEAQAVATYAALRAPDAREWLEKAMARPSHNDVIAEHALSGLASLEDPLALPIVEKAATEPGVIRKRRSAIASLARVAALPTVSSEARQKTVAALAKLVEGEGRRLRTSACDALGVLGKEAGSALALLEQTARADGDGRVRESAKAAADRIKAGTPPDQELARMREEVSRLRDEEEKLLRRLEKVEAKNAAPAPGEPRKADAGRQPD